MARKGIDMFIPKRVIRATKYPAWFSKELRYYMRKKAHFHKLFKSSGVELWHAKFKVYRVLVKKLFAHDKRAHQLRVENSLFRKPDEFWRYVKQHTKDTANSISLRSASGEYLSSPQDVANGFANHFRGCYSSDIFPGVTSPERIVCEDVLNITCVNRDEIAEAIRKLKPKFSVGVDQIPSFIVKGCAELFTPVLEHILNHSLRLCLFPSLWKSSVVVPIHKNGDACAVNNYRPVSLLCTFSKIFEIVVHARLSHYFRHKLSALQHGFSKGRSVETNLCSFLHYSVPFVLNRGQVDTVYFDMSKAFDNVNHKLLLHKLSLYGVSPALTRWFQC